MSKEGSKLDQHKYRQLLNEINELPKSDILLFLKEYNRKNSDFMFDILVHFAPHFDENERIYELILKTEYQKVLKLNSNKMGKPVKRIFGFISEFMLQVEDQIALRNHRQAMLILVPSLRYASKVLYRVETNEKLLNYHIRLHELLRSLVRVIGAPQLKEELFKELAEIASSFYYYPSSRSENLFALLYELKDYGSDLEKLLLHKYEASQNTKYKSILGLYMIEVGLEQGLMDPHVQLLEIVRTHSDDSDFINELSLIAQRYQLPEDIVLYLDRLHERLKASITRERLFMILMMADLDDNARTGIITRHLQHQYHEDIVNWLGERFGKNWKKLAKAIVKSNRDSDNILDIALCLRLSRDVLKKSEFFFDIIESKFCVNLLKLFCKDLFDMDEQGAFELVKAKVVEELDVHAGSQATAWTNEVLRQLSLAGQQSYANQIKQVVRQRFGHRKRLSSALL